MSLSHHQYGSLCSRGLAICLVWLFSTLVWQSSAEATCGDYLTSHGEVHQPAFAVQDQFGKVKGIHFPGAPGGCPNGECHSQEQAPEPAGSMVDNRIVDDLRSFGWLDGLRSQNRKSCCRRTRPADEPLPESPFDAALERPPQAPSV